MQVAILPPEVPLDVEDVELLRDVMIQEARRVGTRFPRRCSRGGKNAFLRTLFSQLHNFSSQVRTYTKNTGLLFFCPYDMTIAR